MASPVTNTSEIELNCALANCTASAPLASQWSVISKVLAPKADSVSAAPLLLPCIFVVSSPVLARPEKTDLFFMSQPCTTTSLTCCSVVKRGEKDLRVSPKASDTALPRLLAVRRKISVRSSTSTSKRIRRARSSRKSMLVWLF